MLKKISISTIFSCLLLPMIFIMPAYCEVPDTIKIAIVDRNKIENESLALIQLRDNVQAYWKSYHEEIRNKEQSLRTKGEEITSNKKNLSQKNLQFEKTKYDNDVIDFQKKIEEKKSSLNTAFQNSSQIVHQHITNIIDDIMKEQNIDLILWRSQAIKFNSSIDITDLVVKKLNKAVPKAKPLFEN